MSEPGGKEKNVNGKKAKCTLDNYFTEKKVHKPSSSDVNH